MNKNTLFILTLLGIILGFLGGMIHPLLTLAGFLGLAGLIFFTLDWINSMYFLSAYLIIDYLFRSILQIDILASLWDEAFLVGCILLLMLKYLTSEKKTSLDTSPIHVPMILFVSVNIFMLLINSTHMVVGIEGMRAIIQHMLWFFIVFAFINRTLEVKRVLFFIVLGCSFIGLYGIIQYIIGVEMPSSWVDMAEGAVRTRAFSILGGPNALGSLMVLSSMLALSLFLTVKTNAQKIFYMSSFLIMSVCMLVTLSRGAWIGYGVAIFIFVLLYDKRYLLPLFACGLIVMLFVPAVADRIWYMLSPQYILSSLTGGRLYRWEQGWEMFLNNFWLGVGPGHFGGAVSVRYPELLGEVFYMDNHYLKTAVEIGFVGLLSFLILIFTTLMSILKGLFQQTKKQTHHVLLVGMFTGMLGLLIHSLFENVFEVPGVTVLFWITAALAMVLLYKDSSRADINKS